MELWPSKENTNWGRISSLLANKSNTSQWADCKETAHSQKLLDLHTCLSFYTCEDPQWVCVWMHWEVCTLYSVMSPWLSQWLTSAHLTQAAAWPAANTSSWNDTSTNTHTDKHADKCTNTNTCTHRQMHYWHTQVKTQTHWRRHR